jgi:hypothetical protein
MNGLIEQEKSERGLTPKQEAFVQYLFGEANFDPVQAKLMAGYHRNTSTSDVLKHVKDIIEQELDAQLLMGGVQGVGALLDVLRDPTKPGNKERIQAANSLLDRIGKTKEAAAQTNIKVEVSPVVYLPDKKSLEMTKEEYTQIIKDDIEDLVPVNKQQGEDDDFYESIDEYVSYDQVDEGQ